MTMSFLTQTNYLFLDTDLTAAAANSAWTSWLPAPEAKGLAANMTWTGAASVTLKCQVSLLPPGGIVTDINDTSTSLSPDDYHSEEISFTAVTTPTGARVVAPTSLQFPFKSIRFRFGTDADITAMYAMACWSAI
jgi:hypothetical protein